jgi:hypothetical protein
MLTETSQKKPEKYICTICDYSTSKCGNYNAHLHTAKHHLLTTTNKKQAEKLLCLYCNKQYQSRPGLWAHKKKCVFKNEYHENNTHSECIIGNETVKSEFNASIVMEIIKENQEFKNLLVLQQQQMMELQNQIIEITKETKISNNTNTNITNTNNTQFNIQLFLNETCKNAINFTDFIDNIQISTDDLENNVKMGFVNGVSKLIMNHLQQLELYDRPIHCTDVKRETIYVKAENQWDKDNSKEILQKGIQEITRKNMCQLSEWREDNPEYDDMETELGEKSIAMQQNSMAGGKREEFYPKIIKNIAKETILDKKKMIE